jgi:putative transposase
VEGRASARPQPHRLNAGTQKRAPPRSCAIIRVHATDRRTPVHHPIFGVGNRAAIIFLTVCTKAKRKLLARDEAVQVILDSWREAHQWLVGRYVVLPDHIHLFCTPCSDDGASLTRWIQYWKAIVSRNWPWPAERPIWQRDFWDRKLRRDESYDDKWEYVLSNPVRHGYVMNADEWPYQGELNELRL